MNDFLASGIFTAGAGSGALVAPPLLSSRCCATAGAMSLTAFHSGTHRGQLSSSHSGTYASFAKTVLSDPNISAIKGKVAKLAEDPATGGMVVEAEDILSAQKMKINADLVVLASGMEASLADGMLAGAVATDTDRFVLEAESTPGIFAAGCARGPVDVATATSDATAAALMAMRTLQRPVAGRASVAAG